jgi:hypothetical protein
VVAGLFTGAAAQKHRAHRATTERGKGRAVLWHNVNVDAQDTYLGPGGTAMQPDLSHIEFIDQEKGGYSTKYKIRDGSGRVWVAKVGKEAQTETAATRLLSAIGYYTDVNYLVPSLTIPGKGTFTNVRLALRPDDVSRKELWSWGKTPFERTPQMQGLKLMMAFINNWDLKSTNNHVLRGGNAPDRYIVGDLGASFGKTGFNSLPIFFRIGRSRNDPNGYAKAKFVSGVTDYKVRVVFHGKNRSKMHDFTKEDARWLADLLVQLKDDQIRDMFRAANYSSGDVHTLTKAVKKRIDELDRAANDRRIAGRR